MGSGGFGEADTLLRTSSICKRELDQLNKKKREAAIAASPIQLSILKVEHH